ncbi:ribonuclease HI [Paraburkholderia sp. UCT31]|uniref:ribonuclease HI n=1 Tax=Paraburkholderia sp. UCT31 TaxID=2615209 RepID=UPI00165668A9|nr:ribonuclease HI [Paraburkholderia sp. UCT31]MBC8741888.1 ribonuclease HI [Paraburkholderia sp. UCT31]
MSFTIYADGSSRGNPGASGWGVFVKNEVTGEEIELFGGVARATNQQMELTAAIEALKSLPAGQRVVLHTDSQYVVKGINEWIAGWKKRGWVNAKKEPVANRELWEALDAQNARHTVTFQWVRGHNGNAGNERADKLANKGAALYL